MGHDRVRRALLWVGAALYLAGLAAVLLWPEHVDRPAAGGISEVFAWLHARGLPGWIGYTQLEWLSNVALFVPLGVFAALLSPWPWAGIVAGLVVSAAAETVQGLFLPGRTASVNDVLANATGAAIGVLAVLAVRRASAREASAP